MGLAGRFAGESGWVRNQMNPSRAHALRRVLTIGIHTFRVFSALNTTCSVWTPCFIINTMSYVTGVSVKHTATAPMCGRVRVYECLSVHIRSGCQCIATSRNTEHPSPVQIKLNFPSPNFNFKPGPVPCLSIILHSTCAPVNLRLFEYANASVRLRTRPFLFILSR